VAGWHRDGRPDGRDHFTLWPAGYPDFPMAQRLRTEQAGGRVTISFLSPTLNTGGS
jgi:hypothetical protein